jgi:hypothetical protein
MSNNSIINLGDLSKPATVLIEKISDAVGGMFKPYQIVRVAKAEAEADQLRAQAQIEITDLQRRAMYRFLQEEAKKQSNIEEITQQALPQLTDQSQPDKLEADWITNFFDRSRLISDKEMQGLWSRILAGEANSPGTFSKKTVNLVADLDKTDAVLFTKLCGFAWMISGLVPLVFDVEADIYNKRDINFGILNHLESMGLIQFESLAGYCRMKLPKTFKVFYYGAAVDLEMPNETDNSLDLGNVLLTKAGTELAPVCGCVKVDGFMDYVRERWSRQGFVKRDNTK